MTGTIVRLQNRFATPAVGLAILIGIGLTKYHSYLLFHTLAEIFSVVIACGIFIIAWNTRRFVDDGFLLFLGIAYLSVGLLDLLHTLAYDGMNIFPNHTSNTATQLWISARYTESLALLIAFFGVRQFGRPYYLLLAYIGITGLIVAAIFQWDVFPDCYVEGSGLTLFKKVSEYVIAAILLSALLLLYRNRESMSRRVAWVMGGAIVVTIASEFSFTLYTDPYGMANMVGHMLKIVSFFLVSVALIETSLTMPYSILFRNLQKSKKALEYNEERIRLLMDSTAEAIYAVDTQGKCTLANPACLRMLGYASVDELIGRDMYRLTHRHEAGQAIDSLEEGHANFLQHMAKKIHMPDEVLWRADGTRFVAECWSYPMRRGDRMVGAVVTLLDVTDRKHAEEALKNRTEDLGKRVKELNCLYSISSLMDQIGISLAEILQKTAGIVPQAWQYPQIACARITLSGEQYMSSGFRETRWKQTCPIVAGGQSVGTVCVCYLEEMPDVFEGPFLEEERRLISAIAETLGMVVEKMWVEDALKASEMNYRTLVEASPDGIVALDRKGYITDCNQEISRLLGYESRQLIGRNIREFVPNVLPSDLMTYYAGVSPVNGEIENEFELIDKHGDLAQMWAKMVPIHDSEGNFHQFVLYLRDIAERKRIDQLKDEFIGLVSHELRNPLTVIIGSINTVLSERERLSPVETDQLLSDAALEAETLSNLIGNLLELSRLQSHRLLLYPEPISIRNAAEQAIGRIKRQSPSHRFELDFPKSLPFVRADQLRIELVLYNLLENATKYSPEGSRIEVSAHAESDCIVVGVRDQGDGISAENQARMFKSFERMEKHEVAGITGIGLGLSVCMRLIEAHGGRIWVESEPDHGSVFFFTLPLR